MDKKSKIYLGSIFLIISAVLYEFDKFLNCLEWSAYNTDIHATGGFDSSPGQISVFDNFYVTLFLIIAGLCYIDAFRKRPENK